MFETGKEQSTFLKQWKLTVFRGLLTYGMYSIFNGMGLSTCHNILHKKMKKIYEIFSLVSILPTKNCVHKH